MKSYHYDKPHTSQGFLEGSVFERSHRATGAFPTSFKHTRYASHGDAMWHQAESFRNVLSLRKQSTDAELLQTLELNQISETASDEETEAQGKPRYPVAAPHLGLPPTPHAEHSDLHRKHELH